VSEILELIEIVNYESKYKDAFKSLNKEWIDQYFVMEEADYKALDHPEEYIIKKGGHILVALLDDQAVGICALVKLTDHAFDYELSKMAVSSEYQGKGIGNLLAKAIIDKAKTHNAKTLYLESNTILTPAIRLYKKLGFKEISGFETPYERSNIQMVLTLS